MAKYIRKRNGRNRVKKIRKSFSNCLFLQNLCCSFYHLFIRYEVDLSERKIRPLSQEKQELKHLAVCEQVEIMSAALECAREER